MEGKPHGVLVDLAPHVHLDALGGPRGQPPAPEPDHGAEDRDRRDHGHQDHQPEPGRLRDRERAPFLDHRGHGASQQDVVDRGLGGRGGNELQQGGDREAQKCQRDRAAMALQDAVQLPVKHRQRPVLAGGGRGVRLAPVWLSHGFPARLRSLAAILVLPLDPFPVVSKVLRETLAAADPSVK